MNGRAAAAVDGDALNGVGIGEDGLGVIAGGEARGAQQIGGVDGVGVVDQPVGLQSALVVCLDLPRLVLRVVVAARCTGEMGNLELDDLVGGEVAAGDLDGAAEVIVGLVGENGGEKTTIF